MCFVAIIFYQKSQNISINRYYVMLYKINNLLFNVVIKNKIYFTEGDNNANIIPKHNCISTTIHLIVKYIKT